MPKMKTKKAVASRFRVTGTGKLKRSQSGLRHILTKKSPKKKRQLSKPGLVAEGWVKKYKQLMNKG